ncbi:unnamed protein product [Auanema sp. JU1783]|nr:unnamed protein product [Auanema sp. JU1783]
METLHVDPTVGLIACCECGIGIQPNAANMCSGCLRSKVDITEGITRTCTIYMCKFCERYFVPPSGWMRAQLESKELLSICLKKLKPCMTKVRLTDAVFVWTEEHSKRIRVKITVQKEVFANTILQQTLIVEFTVHNQMCDDCRRAEAKDFWRACVQVRQKSQYKKTLFYLEQLLLKHNEHKNCSGVKPVPTGIDFFFPKIQDARRLVDFIQTVLPATSHYAQELVSHDTKSNTYDYKHTFCVEIVPICRDDIVILPKHVAQSLGNMSQIVVCLRVSNVITLMDPAKLQMADVPCLAYTKDPFFALCSPKQLTKFYVLDVEQIHNLERGAGHGFVSKKHILADVWLVKYDQVGRTDAETFSARTHIGQYLHPGEVVYGLDLKNCNVNNELFDAMKPENVPDVIIVKKVRDRTRRAEKRRWKLKRLVIDGNIVGNETESVADEFQTFMEDIEDDALMREKINIYKDASKQVRCEETDDDEPLPEGPTIEEMLEDFTLNDREDDMERETGEETGEEGETMDIN